MDPFPSQVYHRKESPTQTAEIARLQEETGEIWGTYNRDFSGGYRLLPSVDAFIGPLAVNERGIEFVTDVPPDPHSRVGLARWTGPRPGVRIEDDYAKIKVVVLRNAQRG